jgi:hypothetical protein
MFNNSRQLINIYKEKKVTQIDEILKMFKP